MAANETGNVDRAGILKDKRKGRGQQTRPVLVRDCMHNTKADCEIDEAGNRWYLLSIATGWPIGTPVVCRRVSRESGKYVYSLFHRWQGAGCGEFEASAMFLRLAR